MKQVDVLITTEEDTRIVFGVERAADAKDEATAYEGVARRLTERFGCSVVAVTLRDNPLVWRNTWSAFVLADGVRHDGPRYEVEIVDRIGAGDAFSAGLIFGAMTGLGWAQAVRYGTALSALKHSIPGDFALSSRAEVEQLLNGGSLRVSR
jgi:2-dehydro-3-deoxygluconokinase